MENNSAGNTVSRHRAASGKLPFLMFCDKEILYHGFLCFASIMVTVTQATVQRKLTAKACRLICVDFV